MNLFKSIFALIIMSCLSACESPVDLYDKANPVLIEFRITTPENISTIIANNSDVETIEVFEDQDEPKYYMIIHMTDEATERIQKAIEQQPGCVLGSVYDKHLFSPFQKQNLKKGTFMTLSLEDKETVVRKASGILSLKNYPDYQGKPYSVLEMMQE